ncbi:MAG: hypothetical protein ACLQRM_13745 [Acidimicrobiales bacterium]
MGYSRDEMLELYREALVELVKLMEASGIPADAATYPAITRVMAFDREWKGNLAFERSEQERLARESVEKFTKPDAVTASSMAAAAAFEAENARRQAAGKMPLFRVGGKR